MAIITRTLEAFGYKVGVIAQPDWKDDRSITALGEPRLAFLVSSGNMDSMVNHYTVAGKKRKNDAYTPGGVTGKRPDYAVAVYGNLIRRTYKHTPILIGGIEASLRRMGHYDYWSDKVKRSVLLDSGADILMYGMGEHSIVAVSYTHLDVYKRQAVIPLPRPDTTPPVTNTYFTAIIILLNRKHTFLTFVRYYSKINMLFQVDLYEAAIYNTTIQRKRGKI